MSNAPQGPGWWQASDGQWYPPEQSPGVAPPPPTPPAPPAAATPAAPTPPPTPAPAPTPPTGPTPYQAPAAAASGERPASVGDAFNWAWSKFQQNLGEIIILGIAAFLILALVVIIEIVVYSSLFVGTLFSSAGSCTTSSTTGQIHCSSGSAGLGFFGILLAGAFFFLFQFVVMFMVQSWFVRGSLLLGYGEKLTMKSMLSTENLGTYFVGALLVGIATAIGTLFCYIPGLIVLFLSTFFGFFILDKKMSAVEGIKASWSLVTKNLPTMIVFFIAAYIAILVGYLVCFVGLIAAFPIVAIASGFMYRRLQGEPVAA